MTCYSLEATAPNRLLTASTPSVLLWSISSLELVIVWRPSPRVLPAAASSSESSSFWIEKDENGGESLGIRDMELRRAHIAASSPA